MSIERMKKLTVFATRSDTDTIVRKLMHMRCVNIERAAPDDSLPDTERFDCGAELSRLSDSVKAVDEALVLLHRYTERVRSMTHRPSVKLAEFMRNEYSEAMGTVSEALSIKREMAEMARRTDEALREISALTPWQRYDLPMTECSTEKTTTLLGCLSSASEAAGFRRELAAAGGVLEVVSRDEKNISYCAVIAHKKSERAISEVLTRFGFTRLAFPKVNALAADEIKRLEEEVLTLEKESARLELRVRELATLSEKVEILRDVEATALAAAENKQKLLSDSTVTVLSGWIPERATEKAGELLDKFGCAYGFEEPAEGEDPPVLLRNNPFSVNFEWVVGMYSYPKYGRFDPTLVMSIFYFLIFGIMFADVGYGLLTAVACFGGVLLLKPKPGLKRSMLMFGFCGLSSILFGAVFGGWFGDMPFAIMTNMLGLENAKQIFPFFNGIWFNPMDDPILFLLFSLAVGFVHIIAGMAVKFYILLKDGMWMDAICETFPWWVVFAGAGVFFLNSVAGICTVAFGLAFVMFAAGRKKKGIFGKIAGGLLGLYDIVNYFSDILSYSRILALGLASAVIAQVVNLIGTMGSGFVGYLIMIAVFLLGHLLNLAINLLGTFVHTSRLQYLEFFGRFYEDGGRPFKAETPSGVYADIEE